MVFSPSKTKWATHTHYNPKYMFDCTGGVLNFPSLVKFCCYFQNKVSHETGLPCPPPLWTKTKNCPKDKSHLPQHHHSSHWVQSPIKISFKIDFYHFISGLTFDFDIEGQELLRNNNSINKFYMRGDLTLKAIGRVLFDLQWLGSAEQRIFGAPLFKTSYSWWYF